jgi:sugar/nucleoside kinase (ribokinase family)
MSISFYGKTYWDVEIQVDIATLSAGKGKVDVPVQLTVGGFACNAARAVHLHAAARDSMVVTVCAPADQERLTCSLPSNTSLQPLLTADSPARFPDISVILNPASDCRILRDPGPADDPLWSFDALAPKVLASNVHALGRVPVAFAAEVISHAAETNTKVAWCGGDALPRKLEAMCHLVCVNQAEAASMLEAAPNSLSTSKLATALAARAKADGAMRMVTGRGSQPTIVAMRVGSEILLASSEPEAIDRADIQGFLGVGDAFAATYIVHVFFTEDGGLRSAPDVSTALRVAQSAATSFLTHARPQGGANS